MSRPSVEVSPGTRVLRGMQACLAPWLERPVGSDQPPVIVANRPYWGRCERYRA